MEINTAVSLLYSFIRICFFVSILLGALLATFTAYIVLVRRRFAHIPIPPFKTFFLGHGGELSKSKVNHHLIMIRWTRQCGPLYCFFVLHRVLIFSSSPEVAQEILMNSMYLKSEKNYKRSSAVFGHRFLGNGLVTNVDHEDWKKKRQAINPAFNRSCLEKLTGVFNDVTDRLIEEIDSFANTGRSMSLLDLLHCTTLDVIGQAAFSFDIGLMADKGRMFPRAIYMCLKGLGTAFRDPTFQYLPWNRSVVKETHRMVAYVRAKARSMINQRIDDIKNERSVPEDILTVMVRGLADMCSMEELEDEIVTMFVAGQETTANAVSFLFIELGRHPEVMDKVRAEVDDVLGTKTFVDKTDITKLEWVKAALKESLRMYAPAPATNRDTPRGKPTLLLGYEIPPLTPVIIDFYGIHYLEHEDGFTFRPERFIRKDAPEFKPELEPKPYTYMPFSLGQRSCIGRYFAIMESQIMISKMLQRYNFELDMAQSLDVEVAGTFKPAGGARFFVRRR